MAAYSRLPRKQAKHTTELLYHESGQDREAERICIAVTCQTEAAADEDKGSEDEIGTRLI